MKVDRSGSLSFAIRGIPSSIQPAIRHSGEGRNPEGWGGVRPPDDGKNSPVAPFSILSRGLHKPMVIPASQFVISTKMRGAI